MDERLTRRGRRSLPTGSVWPDSIWTIYWSELFAALSLTDRVVRPAGIPTSEPAVGTRNTDDAVSNPSFLRAPGELIEDRGAETRTLYLPEVLTGAGLTMHSLPAWALAGCARRTIYLRSRPVTRSRTYQRLRRLVLAPRGLVRRIRRARTGES